MRSVSVGKVIIENPVALAPMAGVTDLVFRNLCREMGAGLFYTEMVSAKAIIYENRNTFDLMRTSDKEHPSAVQLFGSEPDVIEEAASRIRDLPFDFIDLNMGCPVPKVVKNHEGSALMTDPDLAGRVIEAAVRGAKKPVTVKMRSGFDADHINAVEIARIAEDAGASAVAVHARTREQYYSGTADLEIIKRVKDAVHIPVFGNGDIKDGPSAKRMLEQTGCDGIMIGRAAMGDPWIFKRIAQYLKCAEEPPRPSKEEVIIMILRHAKELTQDKGEYIGIRQMRSHAAWYLKGFKGAAELRRRVNEVDSLNEFERIFLA